MLIKESIDFSGMEKALDFIDVQLDKIRLEKKEKKTFPQPIAEEEKGDYLFSSERIMCF